MAGTVCRPVCPSVQLLPSRSIALRVVSILRMTATIATFGFLARGNEAMVEGARFCASTQSRPDAHNARGHRAREALRKWVELWVRSLNGLESRRIYHSIAENLRHAR